MDEDLFAKFVDSFDRLQREEKVPLTPGDLAKLALGEYMGIVAAQPEEGLNEKETLIRAAV